MHLILRYGVEYEIVKFSKVTERYGVKLPEGVAMWHFLGTRRGTLIRSFVLPEPKNKKFTVRVNWLEWQLYEFGLKGIEIPLEIGYHLRITKSDAEYLGVELCRKH